MAGLYFLLAPNSQWDLPNVLHSEYSVSRGVTDSCNVPTSAHTALISVPPYWRSPV